MIRFCARHPTAANLLMLALVVLGALALPQLRRETFPEFSVPMAIVSVAYPGASPDAVEESVVQRLEDAVAGIKGVSTVRSVAREGLGQVTIEIDDGADIPTFMDEVKSKVGGIVDLPEEALEPTITNPGFTPSVASIAVTGPMSAPDLKAYCEQLKQEMKAYPELRLVDVTGFSDHQLQVRLKSASVSQYGLSVRELADAIAAQSVDMPVGSVRTRDGDILVRFADQRRSVRELEDLIVFGGEAGGEVRLGDIAEVRDTFEDDFSKVLFDGKRAGLLQVTMTENQDILVVMEDLQAFLDHVRATKPPGVELTLTGDQATAVEDRLGLLLTNAYQGLLLVFFMLWLFLSFRLAFWVAAGLPVSFLGALFIMNAIGYSLNMMTMMALGLLMDDAIVLAENVASHRLMGKSPMQAAIDGVSEVSMGVLSSFATTAAIFVPLAFLEGVIGKVLLVIPVVLMAVLSVSLIEAFLILPNHLGHMDDDEPSRFRQRFEAWFERVREERFGRAADWCVTNRYITVGGTIGAFIVALGLLAGGVLKFEGFPATDGDTIELAIALPQGGTLASTEEMVTQAVLAAERVNETMTPDQPDGETLVRNISVRFGHNADVGETGSHVATIAVDLLPAEQRNGTVDEITTRWRDEIGPMSDVVSATFTGSTGPAGAAISVEVHGDDLDELSDVADEIAAWFSEFDGAYDLRTDLKTGKPEVRIRMSNGAMTTNLRASQVAQQVRAALSGQVARRIQAGTEDLEVAVSLADSDADTLDDLEYFQVNLGNQQYVPLGAIATLEPGRAYSTITRVDRRRTAAVTGAVDSDVVNAEELMSLFRTELAPKLESEHPTVRFSAGGASKESDRTMTSMLSGFVIGLFAIFILLSFQFRSYVEPLIVLVAIPFALIGVVLGNLLMGTPFSLPGMLGFCALAGVVVNDSILLIEQLKTERRGGATVAEAAVAASRSRFRAVFLTSATTVAGLVPLLFETSVQAQTLVPVATSIVFGTLTSTVLVLVALPSMYAILGDLGWVEKLEKERTDGESEEVPVAPLSVETA